MFNLLLIRFDLHKYLTDMNFLILFSQYVYYVKTKTGLERFTDLTLSQIEGFFLKC